VGQHHRLACGGRDLLGERPQRRDPGQVRADQRREAQARDGRADDAFGAVVVDDGESPQAGDAELTVQGWAVRHVNGIGVPS
jgi:hypothetical protein